MLTDYFRFREICDDEKMDVFFWRDLNIYANRYKALVRVETIDFDPMVNRYFESEFVSNHSNSGTEQGSVSMTGRSNSTEAGNSATSGTTEESSSSTTTVNIVGSENKSGSKYGSNDTTTQSNTTTSNDHTESADVETITKSANKIAPMDASNAGGTSGKLANLDFTYASGYNQTDVASHSSGESHDDGVTENYSTSNGVNSENSSENGTHSENQQTSTASGTNGESSSTTVNNNTISGENSSEQTNAKLFNNSGSDINRNRYTGREGLTPQQAMALASDYLMNYSTAFKWLCKNLEKNFISLYNY